ncbi:MAG: hypothetical protein M3Z17_01105 [Gemmatimonadota bacterium]|nr:hypothetical protein [Gemmatimonadota bacterium]
MNIKWVLAYSCLLLGGCLGSSATNVGDTETTPLVRVDGSPPPFTISDANGGSATIVSGSLTTYNTRSDCDYEIILSTGKKIPGTTSCLAGAATPISKGVQLHLNLASAGAPQGSHDYDFVGAQQPCFCPKNCPCGGDRLTPGSRGTISESSQSRFNSYRDRLVAPLRSDGSQ